MELMSKRDKQSIIRHLDKARELCAKYGMALGNGGDIASMLSGIAGEIANGDAKENEFLVEVSEG